MVDDHEPWRRNIISILGNSRRWQVIGEASDGVTAIHKAGALQPDLILLDVELPAMNGIEAARRILAVAPAARILFVSAHRTWDIVGAAFASGARGYLTKLDVGDGLLPAMNVIADGTRFVSATLTGRYRDGRHPPPPRHDVGFYADESVLVAAYTQFAKAALDAGKTLILVAAESRRDEVHRALRALGVDVDFAHQQRRFLPLDIGDALSTFMVNGWPDEERFWQAGTSLVARAAGTARCSPAGVAVCGEGTATLFREGRVDAAVRLEHLWNELAMTFNVDIFCPYSTIGLDHHRNGGGIQRICNEHTAVIF